MVLGLVSQSVYLCLELQPHLAHELTALEKSKVWGMFLGLGYVLVIHGCLRALLLLQRPTPPTPALACTYQGPDTAGTWPQCQVSLCCHFLAEARGLKCPG